MLVRPVVGEPHSGPVNTVLFALTPMERKRMLPAMEDSGFDTLKAARLLEAAGFESHQLPA